MAVSLVAVGDKEGEKVSFTEGSIVVSFKLGAIVEGKTVPFLPVGPTVSVSFATVGDGDGESVLFVEGAMVVSFETVGD